MQAPCANCDEVALTRCAQCQRPHCSSACQQALGCRLSGCNGLKLMDMPDEMLELVFNYVRLAPQTYRPLNAGHYFHDHFNPERVRLLNERCRDAYDSNSGRPCHASLAHFDSVIFEMARLQKRSTALFCRRLTFMLQFWALDGEYLRKHIDAFVAAASTTTTFNLVLPLVAFVVELHFIKRGLEAVATLYEHIPHRLHGIAAYGCKVKDYTASLAALTRAPALRSLVLSECRLRDGGTSVLAATALGQLTQLTTLDLTGNGIGDVGASALAEALTQHPSLRRLNLEDNRIGLEGATALGKHLVSAPALHQLELDHQGRGANVDFMPSLDDAAVATLVNALSSSKSLRTIALIDAIVGTEATLAIERFLAHTPKRVVHH